MRKLLTMALLFQSTIVGAVFGQSSASTPFSAGSTIATSNRQVDMSQAIAPVQPPQSTQPFSLKNLFRGASLPGKPKSPGVSALPSPGYFPSTWFKNSFQPVQPKTMDLRTGQIR